MGFDHTCCQCLVRISNPVSEVANGQLDLVVLVVGQLDLDVLMVGQLDLDALEVFAIGQPDLEVLGVMVLLPRL